jgi:peptide deformylase
MEAFPTHKEEGMDLRDYFAAKVIQGEISHDGLLYGDRADENDRLAAKRAYKMADAMIKARENDE